MSKITDKAKPAGKEAPRLIKAHINKYFDDHKTKVKRWNLVSFESWDGYDSAGIVDIIAVRRNHKSKGAQYTNNVDKEKVKSGDLLRIILMDVKGSSIGKIKNPKKEDIPRLTEVGKYYNAERIILAKCQMDKRFILVGEPKFYELPQSWKEEEFKGTFDLKREVQLRNIFE